MNRNNRWMVGWIEKKQMIQKWKIGWIEKMDGWMDKKQMDGWMDRIKIDGWLNGYIFLKKLEGWTGKHRRTVGWIDKWMAGWI